MHNIAQVKLLMRNDLEIGNAYVTLPTTGRCECVLTALAAVVR